LALSSSPLLSCYDSLFFILCSFYLIVTVMVRTESLVFESMLIEEFHVLQHKHSMKLLECISMKWSPRRTPWYRGLLAAAIGFGMLRGFWVNLIDIGLFLNNNGEILAHQHAVAKWMRRAILGCLNVYIVLNFDWCVIEHGKFLTLPPIAAMCTLSDCWPK
jgi:hypothetical protein